MMSLRSTVARRALRQCAGPSARALSTWGPDWELKPETLGVHGGWAPDPTTGARAVPVHRTTPYQFRDTDHAAALFSLQELGFIYTRLGNPTVDVLEKRFALMSGAHELGGLGVASGTNAVFYAIANIAEAGDNIVASASLYGGTYTMMNDLLPKLGIEVRFVDVENPAAFRAAADGNTRAFFCETVANPSLVVADIEAIAKEAHDEGVPLVVDDTFTTPALMKPLEHGADVVVDSLTKWAGGHGVAIGGVIVDGGKFDWSTGRHPAFTRPDTSYGGLRWGVDLPEPLLPLAYILRARCCALRNLGGAMSPDNAWAILLGLETLHMRMEKHCSNAAVVADFLKDHPKVSWVRFPGFKEDSQHELAMKYMGNGGSMVVFGLQGDDETARAAGRKLIDGLKLHSHVANVGDARSLAIHPSTTTHSQLNPDQQRAAGCPPEMVRLSVGIEHPDDIVHDLRSALDQI